MDVEHQQRLLAEKIEHDKVRVERLGPYGRFSFRPAKEIPAEKALPIATVARELGWAWFFGEK